MATPARPFTPMLLLVVLLMLAASCTAGNQKATTEGPTPPTTLPAPAPAPAPADWQITHPGKPGEIEGFADHTSVTPGEPVQLFVSTSAQNYTVTAFRVGATPTQPWRSEPQKGVKQPPAVVQAPTSTVVAPWQPSLTVPTAHWEPGDYLFRLTPTPARNSSCR